MSDQIEIERIKTDGKETAQPKIVTSPDEVSKVQAGAQ